MAAFEVEIDGGDFSLVETVVMRECLVSRPQRIGVRAGGGGARGAAAPPNFGQLRFFGQQEKIWAKPVYKDVSMSFLLYL